jgi:hypothetical protein
MNVTEKDKVMLVHKNATGRKQCESLSACCTQKEKLQL